MVERRSNVLTHDDLEAINQRLVGHCERMERIEGRLENGAGRMERIEVTLDENTKLTREVVSILGDGKAAFRLLGYVGSIAKWLTAIFGLIATAWALFHIGPEK